MSAPAIISSGTAAGGPPVGGSGTSSPSTIPRWTGASTLGDSIITQSGSNIGIGTASPGYKLDVAGVINTTDQVRVFSSATSADVRLNAGFGGTVAGLGTVGAQPFMFFTSNTERARIDSSGNLLMAGNGTAANPIIANSTGVSGMYFPSATTVAIAANGAIAATFSKVAGAGVALGGTTGLVFDASGNQQGIKLRATPDSTDTQTLDCYQENTGWVPTITFGGASTGMTYTTQAGSWTKIGNLVFVTGRIVLSAKGSSTGVARLANLPVAVGASNASGGGMVGPVANITFGGQLAIYAVASATTLGLAKNTSGGAAVDLTDADFTNTSDITFSCIYRV